MKIDICNSIIYTERLVAYHLMISKCIDSRECDLVFNASHAQPVNKRRQ